MDVFDAAILQDQPAHLGLHLSGALILVDLRGANTGLGEKTHAALWEHLEHPRIKRSMPVVGASNPGEWREAALRLGESPNFSIVALVIVADSAIRKERIRDWALWGRGAGFLLITGVNLPEIHASTVNSSPLFDFTYEAEDVPGLLFMPNLILRQFDSMIGYDLQDIRLITTGRKGRVLPVTDNGHDLAKVTLDWQNRKKDRELLGFIFAVRGSIPLAEFDEAYWISTYSLPEGDRLWVYWHYEIIASPELQLCVICN